MKHALDTGSSCYGCVATLTNGLSVTNASGSLTFGGTPTSTGTVSFQVTVKDNTGVTYGPVGYTIQVNNEVPVSLPAASSNPLGPGMLGVPYGGTINASGGPGSGNYSFVVNGTTIPTNNTATTAAGSDGLTSTNSGGNSLFVGGTPTTAETVSLDIEVIDTTNTSDNATVDYSVTVRSTHEHDICLGHDCHRHGWLPHRQCVEGCKLRGHHFNQDCLHHQYRLGSVGGDHAKVSNTTQSKTLRAVNHPVGRLFICRQTQPCRSLPASIAVSLLSSKSIPSPKHN